MAVTNTDIQAWVAQNAGASEAAIAAAMRANNVTPAQFAAATGADAQYVADRYNAITTTKGTTTAVASHNNDITNADIQAHYQNALASGMSMQQIVDDMQKYKVGATQYLNALNLSPDQSKQALYNYLDVVNPQQAFSLRSWENGANEWADKGYISAKFDTKGFGYDPIGYSQNNMQNGITSTQSLNNSLNPIQTQQMPQEQPAWLNNMQNWWNQQQQQQQAPASYTPSTQLSSPQYTPNYANNALMRPITENSNITGQNQYGNMGFNNKRSSLWGDW